MKGVVIIIRGASCSGKSAFASYLASIKKGQQAVVCTADDAFYNKDGEYVFVREKLAGAHNLCKMKFLDAIHDGKELIIVANTNTTKKEFSYYKDVAEDHDYLVFFTVLEKRHNNQNSHNCPQELIERQAKNILHYIKLT